MTSEELSDGEKLARVLQFYGLIDTVESSVMKIMCPFHSDKNPSMSVNFDNGLFYCFGCDSKGNAEKFVKLIEKQNNGANDLKAFKTYTSILNGSKPSGYVIKKISPEATRRHQRQLYDIAYDTYHGLKKVSWMSSDELDVITVKDYMLNRGFNSRTLSKVGAKVTYRKNYPIIFPMKDNGIFKGWVCRTTNKEVEARRKYLYNKGFSRATTLVGDYGPKYLDNETSKYVIIVEGYMDRLKFVQFGVKNAVAILGWKMSDCQIRKLKEAGIEVVVSALDNDDCGRKGTKFLEKNFKVVRWCYLKGVKDPGDMDETSFRKMFNKTKQKLCKVL